MKENENDSLPAAADSHQPSDDQPGRCPGCGYGNVTHLADGRWECEMDHCELRKAVMAERERCAKIAERMTCVYGGPPLRTDGFNLATKSIAREIRNTDSGCEPPQAKPPCTFCGHTSCNSIDCYARQAFVDRDTEDPSQTELVVPARLYREAIETLRDKFALAALAGFGTGVAADRTAQLCYAQADAMIEARKKS